MKINTVQALLEEEIKDIYDFEKRLLRAIPKMAKAASSDELRSALTEHLEVTRQQVERIEQVFELLGVPARSKPCAGMKGLIEEGDEVIEKGGADILMDVAIIGAAQRVEHYEMAAYAAARSLANRLGSNAVAELLQETWDEEQEADDKLASLAEALLAGTERVALANGAKGRRKGAAGGRQ